jgi:polyphenol oxidase
LNPDWLIPDWPAPAGVRAVFTSRQGGFSALPFDSLNLGDHVGDQPEKVAANRAALQSAIGSRAVFLKQVHGNQVRTLGAAAAEGQVADACITSERRIACTIMVADCLPVLFTNDDGSVVAAAHAGWRGLAGSGANANEKAGKGVLESVHESFSALAQVNRAPAAMKIIAWLGPCIGPSAFEVGEEVKAAFERTQPEASRFFEPMGSEKYLADLAGLARLRLHALGVTDVYGNDGSPAWCTVSNPSRFFSHRRDAGVAGNGFRTTGRMAAAVWRI